MAGRRVGSSPENQRLSSRKQTPGDGPRPDANHHTTAVVRNGPMFPHYLVGDAPTRHDPRRGPPSRTIAPRPVAHLLSSLLPSVDCSTPLYYSAIYMQCDGWHAFPLDVALTPVNGSLRA